MATAQKTVGNVDMPEENRESSVFRGSSLHFLVWALGALVLLAILLLTYCSGTRVTSSGALDRQRLAERTAAQDELAAAREANARLRRVETENETLRRALEREVAGLETSRAENAQLLQDQELLRAENARLREGMAERNALRAENERLLRTRESLRAENAQIRGGARAEESLRAENAQLKERLEDELERGGERRVRPLREALERERRRKFLMVMISWPGNRGDDVDLHVVDPRGDEFFYGARIHEGSLARFEEDSRNGPGNEVWLHPHVAAAGEYRIYYSLFDGGPVTVRGTIVASATDRYELAPLRLNRRGEKLLVATVVVRADSTIEVVR